MAHSNTSKEEAVAGARVREATWEVMGLEGLEEPDLEGPGAQQGPLC